MPQNIRPNLSNCTNCGAAIKETILTQLKVCEYCGTRLSTAQGESERVDTLIARKKISEQDLSMAIAKWLYEPPLPRPALKISEVSILWSTLIYYPVYIYRGRIRGEWRLRDRRNIGDLFADDFQLNVYACTNDSVYHAGDVAKASGLLRGIGGSFGRQDVVDPAYVKEVVSFAAITADDAETLGEQEEPGDSYYEFGMDEDSAWRVHGRQNIDERIDFNITLALENHAINRDSPFDKRHDITFSQKAKLFIPVWEVCIAYEGNRYYLAADAVKGEVVGDTIKTQEPRLKVDLPRGFDYSIILFCLWFFWGVIRWEVPSDSIISAHSKYFDNILISPTSGDVYTWRVGIVLAMCFVGVPVIVNIIRKKRIADATRDPTDNYEYATGIRSIAREAV